MFRRRLEHRHEVQHKIVVGLLAAVEAERQGLGVDREVTRETIAAAAIACTQAGKPLTYYLLLSCPYVCTCVCMHVYYR